MYRGPIPERYLALHYESKSCKTKVPHCCETMKHALDSCNIAISYSPKYREYFIPVLSNKPTNENINALQGILYCPWCNIKLPPSTREEWFEILEQDYRINDPWDEEQEKVIPDEFKTDEWWIKRNL